MSNICIVYLASPLDGYNAILSTGEKRFDMMCMSLKNVTTHLKLPVIIFHEDFTDDVMNRMRDIYNNISFEKIDMIRDDLEFIQKPCVTSKLSNNICTCKKQSHSKNPKSICFRPKGYLMMCRFFSGEMQKHPSIQKYDGYIRFDDDSFLIEPYKNQDDFINSLINHKYVYRSLFRESQDQSSLFKFTVKFCADNGMDTLKILRNCVSNKVLTSNYGYQGIAPYNNFHYSSLDVWKHPIIKKYIDELEDIGGCLKKGWMDANIHAMIIFLIMPNLNMSVENIRDFGYRHNRAFSAIGNPSIVYMENERFFPLVDLST